MSSQQSEAAQIISRIRYAASRTFLGFAVIAFAYAVFLPSLMPAPFAQAAAPVCVASGVLSLIFAAIIHFTFKPKAKGQV